MKPYLITYKFYYDEELYKTTTDVQLLNEPYIKYFSGTDFAGLWDLKRQYTHVIPFQMWEFKKGKRYLQTYDAIFKKVTPKNVKPWKLAITSEETSISMRELMSFNSEDVIKYLKERGITTCPIIK